MMERYPDSESICEVMELVASVSLGFHSTPRSAPAKAPWTHDVWTGCVGVAGGFRGAITLTCTKEFAYRATRAMLPSEAVDDAGARDVIAELTNVIGGNIKSLLAECSGTHSNLSVPTVTAGAMSVPNSEVVREQWCDLDGDTVLVTLFEMLPEPERGSK